MRVSKNFWLNKWEGNMGGLIPNPHDDIVKQKLDKQFSDPHLGSLRSRILGPAPVVEPHFFSDPGHSRHLYRISHRLQIWPEPDPMSGEPPPTTAQLKARWQALLQKLLTDPVKAHQQGTPDTVAEYIRKALHVFVVTDAAQCTSITFTAIHDTTLPAGIDYQANINPDPTKPRPAGSYPATIQLRCRQEIPAGTNAPDPGPDPGEVPPDQPNV